MTVFKVAEAPIASSRRLVGATDAAQTFAPLHALEQDLKHGACSFADGNDENALVSGEIDDGGAAAVGHEPLELLALEAQAVVECGRDVASLEGAGKNPGCRGVH